jgi:hypothetical protein
MNIKYALPSLRRVGRQRLLYRGIAPDQLKAANENCLEWLLMPFPEGWYAAC